MDAGEEENTRTADRSLAGIARLWIGGHQSRAWARERRAAEPPGGEGGETGGAGATGGEFEAAAGELEVEPEMEGRGAISVAGRPVHGVGRRHHRRVRVQDGRRCC